MLVTNSDLVVNLPTCFSQNLQEALVTPLLQHPQISDH